MLNDGGLLLPKKQLQEGGIIYHGFHGKEYIAPAPDDLGLIGEIGNCPSVVHGGKFELPPWMISEIDNNKSKKKILKVLKKILAAQEEQLNFSQEIQTSMSNLVSELKRVSNRGNIAV